MIFCLSTITCPYTENLPSARPRRIALSTMFKAPDDLGSKKYVLTSQIIVSDVWKTRGSTTESRNEDHPASRMDSGIQSLVGSRLFGGFLWITAFNHWLIRRRTHATAM